MTDTTKFVYEYDKVVLELDGNGNQTAYNVYGGDMLISRTVDGSTLYYLYNGHGDVVNLTNASGNVVVTYDYDPFGNVTTETGNAANSYLYAGYQHDEETGLYYLNARYYDPVTAQFLTEDTYTGQANDPLSLNLYTYCSNNPTIYSDSTGHKQKSFAKNSLKVNKKVSNQAKSSVVQQSGYKEKYFSMDAGKVLGVDKKKATNQVKSSATKSIKTTETKAIANERPVVLSVAKGICEGIDSTISGVVSIVAHPIKTGEAIVTAVSHPIQTAKVIANSVQTTVKDDLINGNAETRAKAVTEIVLAVVGTKGVGEATKAIKAAQVAEVAITADEAATVAAESAIKGAQVAEVAIVADETATVAEVTGTASKVATVEKSVANVAEDGAAAAAEGAAEASSRISYSKYFDSELKNFNEGYEIKDVIDADMTLVQFHSDAAVGQGRSLKFWTSAEEANKFSTIDEYMNNMALLSEWGDRGTVSVSKIPAGTKVKYAIGTAREQANIVTGEVRSGGGLQILFDEFDPNWVVQTREIL